jgi:hypothetical protein
VGKSIKTRTNGESERGRTLEDTIPLVVEDSTAFGIAVMANAFDVRCKVAPMEKVVVDLRISPGVTIREVPEDV